MDFVNDHKVPWCGCDIGCLVAGEVVGADDDTVFDFEWAKISLLDCLVVGFCLSGMARRTFPSVPGATASEIRWRDDQQPPLTLGPFLGKEEPRLDGLSETDFVCQQRAS